MKLATHIALIIFSLSLLISSTSNAAGIKNEGEKNGIFQITRLGSRSAQFQFITTEAGTENRVGKVVEVSVGPDEDIRRGVVRKMIDMIRQYHAGDFNWESYRLGRLVVLSARKEDSEGLEDFLMREFFINDQLVQVDPEQVKALQEKGIRGNVIVKGVFTGEGTVREPVILESSDPALEKVVIKSVLTYRVKPLWAQSAPREFSEYRQVFNFRGGGTDERSSRHVLPKKTDHLPVQFHYDIPPVALVVAPVVYPLNLLQDDKTGSAKVAVVIDPDGNVRQVQILEATHPEFGFATRGMMQSWEFAPATKEGKRTWAIFTLEQKFNRSAVGLEVSKSASDILQKLKNRSTDIYASTDLDSLPKALYQPIPAYPPLLFEEGVTDRVIAEFFIDEDGDVQLPNIVKSTNDELAWAALTAISRWHFEPPLHQGRPVVTRVRVPISFSTSQKVDGN